MNLVHNECVEYTGRVLKLLTKIMNKKSHNKVHQIQIPKEIHDMNEDIIKEADKILNELLSRSIIEIDKFSKSEIFHETTLKKHKHHDNSNENNLNKKRKCDLGEDTHNDVLLQHPKNIDSVFSSLKAFSRELLDNCSKLQLWIKLMIPKIEDGNNFGVSIQEDIFEEIGRVISDVSANMEQIPRYLVSRAKLVSKCLKYPTIHDYFQSVDDIDERIFIGMKVLSVDLRNYNMIILDLINKNIDKIRNPRSSNVGSMF